MADIYEEVKTPYRYGPVLATPPDAELVDSPSVFRHGNRWYMVHLVFREDGYETRLASSPNLLDWTAEGTILPFRPGAWDQKQAAGYIALQDPEWGGSAELQTYAGRYWMTYLGGLATSVDLRGESTGPVRVSASHTWAFDSPQALVDGVIADEPRWTAYLSPNTVDWVQVDFERVRRCDGFTIHLYDDRGGVQPPRQMFVEHLHGHRFQQVTHARWNPAGPGPGANTVTFDPVHTRSLRVHFVHREGGYQKPGRGIYSGATEIEFT
jgi:hypothetical protein